MGMAKDMHMTSSLHTNFVDTLACTLPLSHKLRAEREFSRHLAVVPVLVVAIHGICIHYDDNPFVFVPQRRWLRPARFQRRAKSYAQ